ncbi:MAG: bifunctional oligoribonuclease/PAP phosphatase NrnA [Vicinamibacterales bacterium]|nr:bifunctional oligoribonuclease/PAP phosphatase NrnA [Vicinamibacterales bacterium]
MSAERLPGIVARICDELRRGQRFLVTSHARPDGDSIGSQVALALALGRLGKAVRVVNRDAPPVPYRVFAGVSAVEVAEAVEGDFDALIVMECGDLGRPGVAGLERYRAINIDHHLGNTDYGALNWFDASYAACAEMVVEVIDGLGVPLDADIAAALYLGIVTDTGSFRHAGVSARTFDVCRRLVEAGVDPARMARLVFDSSTIGRLRLMGALLDGMALSCEGRLAVLALDQALLRRTGATVDDLDGLINVPLQVRSIEAVVMFKQGEDGHWRASARSKGEIDVRAVASRFGGGGHRNAAGFDVPGNDEAARAAVVTAVAEAMAAAVAAAPPA